ncbi:MAG: hypothetical protein Fur0041_01140 [Bacteroidia bacterium]
MKKILLALLTIYCVSAHAQKFKERPGGQLSIGARSTMSLFTDENGNGNGIGGHIRLRLLNHLNTEWFADYLNSTVAEGLGTRQDYHIGWSVMFYPPFAYFNNKRYVPQPYFIAGHCFDYTRVASNNPVHPSEASRWSSAIQGGLGFHIPLTKRIDFTTTAQYMMHLGNVIEADVRTNAATNVNYIYVDTAPRAGLEGHLLVTCSMNFMLVDLWRNKIKGVQDGKPEDNEPDAVGY